MNNWGKFLQDHFAEITLIWLALVLVATVIVMSFIKGVDMDTLAWVRGGAGGFMYALLLALKLQTGTATKEEVSGLAPKESTKELPKVVDGKEGE